MWCGFFLILYGIVCSISVWINLFLVWTCTTSVWWYNLGVNRVTRVNKTIRCDSLSMVYIILSWYEHTNTVWSYLVGATQGVWCDPQRMVWTKCLWCDKKVLWCDQQFTIWSHVMVGYPYPRWCDQTSNGVIRKMSWNKLCSHQKWCDGTIFRCDQNSVWCDLFTCFFLMFHTLIQKFHTLSRCFSYPQKTISYPNL